MWYLLVSLLLYFCVWVPFIALNPRLTRQDFDEILGSSFIGVLMALIWPLALPIGLPILIRYGKWK
jgi:hypothetical protein